MTLHRCRLVYLKSCLLLWVSAYGLYSSTALRAAHRHILMSSSKYNMLKKCMKSILCRQGYLISVWAISWVHSGWKSTAEKLVSLLSLSRLPVCLLSCLTSWLKIRSRALWYSSSRSSIDLLCFSRKG